MPESTIKSGRKQPFTVLYNSVLRDKRLSLKTKGLFAIMMSLPDNWQYSISGLASYANVGKDAVRSALKELTEVGYLVKDQSHDERGKFSSSVYILQDEAPPLSGFPTTGNPTTDLPLSENPTLQKNNLTKDYQTKPPTPPAGDELFDSFWKAYPKKKAKDAARRAWKRLAPDLELCRKMAAALERQKRSRDWTKEGGQFVPYPATWLNQRRWEDEDEAPAGGPPDPGGRVVETEEVLYL